MALVEDLYNKLSEGGYYTKSLGEFEAQLEDPMYRKKVHTVLTRDGIEDTDFETFDVKYTPLKKKEESVSPSMADTTSGLLVTPEMATPEPLVSSSLGNDPVISSNTPDTPEINIMEYTDIPMSRPVDFTTTENASVLFKRKKKKKEEDQKSFLTKEEKKAGELTLKESYDTYNKWQEKRNKELITTEEFGSLPIDVDYSVLNQGTPRKEIKEVTVTAPQEKKKKFKDKFEEFYYTYIYPMGKTGGMREYFRLLKENQDNPEFKDFLKYAVEEDDIYNDARNTINYDVFRSGEGNAQSILNGVLSKYGYTVDQAYPGQDYIRVTSPGKQVIELPTNVIGGAKESKRLLDFIYNTWRDEKEYRYIGQKDYEDGEKGLNNYMDDVIDFALTDINKFKNLVDEDVFQASLERRSKDISYNVMSLEDQINNFNTLYGEYSSKVSTRNDLVKTYNDELNKYKKSGKKDLAKESELKSYYQKIQDLEKSYDFNGQLKKIQDEQSFIKDRKSLIEKEVNSLDKMSNALTQSLPLQQAEKEKQGSFLGFIGAKLAGGIIDIAQATSYLTSDIMTPILGSIYGAESIMPQDEYEKLKEQGLSDFEVFDKASKQLKKTITKDVNKVGELYFDTTEEYMKSKDRTTFEIVVGSVVESLGAAAAAPKGIGFFAQSYANIEEMMLDPSFDGVSEMEKKLISVPYAIAMGALERFGYNVLSGSNKSLTNKLIIDTISRSMAKLPKNASIDAIKHEINKELSSMLVTGTLDIALSAGAEGVVEGAQSLTETGIKNVVNAIYDKELFQDIPDITTYNGIVEALGQAGEESYYGALGGLMFATVSNSYNIIKERKFNKQSNELFDQYEKLLKDNTTLKTVENLIKIEVDKGNITEEQALEVLNSVKECQQVINTIPNNLSTDDKRISFDLLLEKKGLEQDIAGKDEALITGQRERIEQINNDLKIISKNAIEKSTKQQQEGTAEGGVVQREGVDQGQPEVGQGEGAVGETTQPEADLGNRPITGGGIQTEEVAAQPIVEEEVVIDKPTIATNSSQELERVKTVAPEVEDGATFNLDGTVYEGTGLVVPVVSVNTTVEEATPEMIADFVEQNADKIGDNETVKVGIYKFPNSNEMSIDLNVVAPESSREQAIEFGRLADQESLFDLGSFQNVKTGGTGKNPMQFSGTQFKEIAKALKEGRLPNVFEQAPSQSSMGTVISGTDVEIDNQAAQIAKPRMTKIVANAAKAVSRILPNTKFIVHDIQDSFTAATGETDAGGYFNPATGEIHINLEQANARTVAHEVFHAVLLNAVKTDANAAVTTRKMIEAVSKKIESNPKLKQYLDEFASNYDENIQNEEKVSELVGVLAEQYELSPESVKDVIKRWLDRIAKTFGLNPFNRNEVYDVLNTVARKTAKGKTIKASDINMMSIEGVTTNIKESKGRKQKVKVSEDQKLTFVTKEDLIDIDSLIAEIANNNQKVWFWVADQLGRGNYYDAVINGEHFLDAGPSFALDPVNRDRNVIWASGANKKTLQNNINKSDYIFIISGSPQKSKLFNKTVTNLVRRRIESVGKFDKFKKELLESNPTSKLKNIISNYNSYEDLFMGPERKDFILAINEQQSKNTNAKKVLEKYNAFVDLNNLRDGFYESNKFNMGDIMIVLKADGLGEKSNHSTYETDILGSVVGVPDKVINAYDIMPDEIKNKYRDNLSESEKIQVVAPYGIGIKDVSPRKQKALPKEVADKLTEDGNGNYVFHHYSGKRRETIQPRSGDNIITSREEAAALSSVGGVAQFYTQEGQKEAGVGPILHTIVVPKDKVYYLQEDPENFYDEAKRQFLEVRPGQAFSPNYQAAWIGKVASDNGYDMLVSNWRGDQLRAQTVKELTPIEENIPFKEKDANVYKVGDEVIVYGSKATITAMDGTVATFKGEGVSGSIDTDRNASLITKVRRQKKRREDLPSFQIMEKSKKYMDEKTKRTTVKNLNREYLREFEDRQVDIKKALLGIGNKYSQRAYDILVSKAGASGWANERFKEADKKIFGGLRSKSIEDLNSIIYNLRIIAINENRAERGMKPYTGMDVKVIENGKEVVKPFTSDIAKSDLEDLKQLIGEKQFKKLEGRAKEYFKVFNENLLISYESGRITKEVYESLRDIDYSPIRTIKYMIGESVKNTEQQDKMSRILGLSIDDIKSLGDENKNAIVNDARWLMMMGINASAFKSFENKLFNAIDDAYINATDKQKEVFNEFYLDNPVVGKKNDGSPIFKYDKEAIPEGFSKITFYKNGIKKKMVIEDRMASQLYDVRDIKQAAKDEFVKNVGKFTLANLLRFRATGGNPLFIVSNIPMDFFNVLFFSDVYGKMPIIGKFLGAPKLAFDFVKNFLKSSAGGKFKEIKREFLKYGGGMDYMATDGIRMFTSKYRRIKKDFDIAREPIVLALRLSSFLGEKSEEAFRLSVYEKTKNDLIKKYKKDNEGKAPEGQDLEDILFASVREAREIVDFNQGGNLTKRYDAFLPYLNVGFQSFRRAKQFAIKHPVRFADSMIQITILGGSMMAASISALIRGACEDGLSEEECNKKVLDAVNSVPQYIRANYFVFFTGDKDEEGNWEYYKLRKTPILAVPATFGEQTMIRYFLGARGIDYDPSGEIMKQTWKSAMPFDPEGLAGKNPLISAGIAYGFNYDVFRKTEIFKKPKQFQNMQITAKYEGKNDDNVNNFFKYIADTYTVLGYEISPIRLQAAVEKFITSETTNPTTSLLYATANGLFVPGTDTGEAFSEAIDKFKENVSKKFIGYTSKSVLENQSREETIEERELIGSDIYDKTTKMWEKIDNIYNSGKILTMGELYNMVVKDFGTIEAESYFNKFNDYISNRGVDKRLLNIVYERNPRLQALYIYQRYGNSIDQKEIDELNTIMSQTRSRISNKAMMLYNQNYYKK